MKRLENLSDIANRQLGGLEASPTLLAKIKLEAAEKKQPRSIRAVMRPMVAVCAALVLCAGAVMTVTQNDATPGLTINENVLQSRSAGVQTMPTEQPRTAGDMPHGSISMSASARRSNDTLFAQEESSGFPLISLNGATYRMLTAPDALSTSLLGDTLGTVTEFNIEPALSAGGVVSNTVSLGENVYAIGSSGSALVAANAEGGLRVFQRVSYAGTAIIGSETLQDTLCAPEDAEWIEIAGMGRVAEPETVLSLMNTLFELADYQSTAFSNGASMQIGLKNGLVLQLTAGEDSISACGTWSCPDFFEAFTAAAE